MTDLVTNKNGLKSLKAIILIEVVTLGDQELEEVEDA
jgi:hypothetical protein